MLDIFKFKLAMYSIEGKFLGWSDLKDQLLLCDSNSEYRKNFLKIGHARELSCSFDLSKLLDKSRLPKYANVFFDVFIEDIDRKLYDVPVDIQQVESQEVQNSNIGVPSKLGRRFFLIDTLVGINDNFNGGSYRKQSRPEYVRYAKSLRIKVSLSETPQ